MIFVAFPEKRAPLLLRWELGLQLKLRGTNSFSCGGLSPLGGGPASHDGWHDVKGVMNIESGRVKGNWERGARQQQRGGWWWRKGRKPNFQPERTLGANCALCTADAACTVSTFVPAVEKRASLAIFWLLYSWFTDWHRQTSAVQQRLAYSIFHCLFIISFSWLLWRYENYLFLIL